MSVTASSLKFNKKKEKITPNKFRFYQKFVNQGNKNWKGNKENHVSLDTPENMGQEKIILTQKENIARKRKK